MNEQSKSTNKLLLWLQTLALTAGAFIGWYTVIREIDYFCDTQGSGISGLLSFSGTLTTNPIATPCFWGSIMFIVGIVWSLFILLQKDKAKLLWHQTRLVWLLAGATIFALANNVYTFYKYYSQDSGTNHFGCPADKIENPFMTACFAGFLAFSIALVFGYVYLRSLKSISDNEN